ncbi:MAG: hypothetical protein C4527_29095 [Candidatus Omnitrophota bacterium]|nr:MAG: hypothetical protein C4527_29095 [Candidatus Omnitrophota bacterium]
MARSNFFCPSQNERKSKRRRFSTFFFVAGVGVIPIHLLFPLQWQDKYSCHVDDEVIQPVMYLLYMGSNKVIKLDNQTISFMINHKSIE